MPVAGAVVTSIGTKGRNQVRDVRRFVLIACVAVSACTSTGPTSPTSDATTSTTPPPAQSSASSTPSSTLPAPSTAPSAALQALSVLAVKGRAPRTGYDRDRFGPSWTDDNDVAGGRNGCDTRNDVLARDLVDDVVKPGTRNCVVLRGVLRDPYTATTISFVRGEATSSDVQIDHVVALSNAWQTGAQQLTERERRNLANDPIELLAVDGSANQSKGDGDAATWLPPNRAYGCAYVARQISVKQRYRLWVTPPERDAMQRILTTCPRQPLPQA